MLPFQILFLSLSHKCISTYGNDFRETTRIIGVFPFRCSLQCSWWWWTSMPTTRFFESWRICVLKARLVFGTCLVVGSYWKLYSIRQTMRLQLPMQRRPFVGSKAKIIEAAVVRNCLPVPAVNKTDVVNLLWYHLFTMW